jgi:hypothetical protein
MTKNTTSGVFVLGRPFQRRIMVVELPIQELTPRVEHLRPYF